MSQDLITDMALVKKDISTIKDAMLKHNEDNKEAHKEFRQGLDDIKLAIADGFERLDDKFANKWVEKAMTWFLYSVVGILITSLVTIIIARII